jgi:hypothetical protein
MALKRIEDYPQDNNYFIVSRNSTGPYDPAWAHNLEFDLGPLEDLYPQEPDIDRRDNKFETEGFKLKDGLKALLAPVNLVTIASRSPIVAAIVALISAVKLIEDTVQQNERPTIREHIETKTEEMDYDIERNFVSEALNKSNLTDGKGLVETETQPQTEENVKNYVKDNIAIPVAVTTPVAKVKVKTNEKDTEIEILPAPQIIPPSPPVVETTTAPTVPEPQPPNVQTKRETEVKRAKDIVRDIQKIAELLETLPVGELEIPVDIDPQIPEVIPATKIDIRTEAPLDLRLRVRSKTGTETDTAVKEKKRLRKDKKNKKNSKYLAILRLVNITVGTADEVKQVIEILLDNLILPNMLINIDNQTFVIKAGTRASELLPKAQYAVLEFLYRPGKAGSQKQLANHIAIDWEGFAKGVAINTVEDFLYGALSKAERKALDKTTSGPGLYDLGNHTTWERRIKKLSGSDIPGIETLVNELLNALRNAMDTEDDEED